VAVAFTIKLNRQQKQVMVVSAEAAVPALLTLELVGVQPTQLVQTVRQTTEVTAEQTQVEELALVVEKLAQLAALAVLVWFIFVLLKLQ
jgi:hypothetical protein